MAENAFSEAPAGVDKNEFDALTAIARMGRAGLAQQGQTVGAIEGGAGSVAGAIAAPGLAAGAPGQLNSELGARAAALQALYIGNAQGLASESEQEFLGQEAINRNFYGQARQSIPAYASAANSELDRYRAAAAERDKGRMAALASEQAQREIALANVSAAQAQASASIEGANLSRQIAAEELALRRAGMPTPVRPAAPKRAMSMGGR